MTMKAVGIKQLKARLSEYVRMARAGQTVLVTDRDEVVAELRPPQHHARPLDSTEEVLESLAEKGELSRASLPKRGWAWKVGGLGLPAGTASALLDDLRSDRGQ